MRWLYARDDNERAGDSNFFPSGRRDFDMPRPKSAREQLASTGVGVRGVYVFGFCIKVYEIIR